MRTKFMLRSAAMDLIPLYCRGTMSLSNFSAVGVATEEGRQGEAQDNRAFFFSLASETGLILTATAKWLSTEDEKNFRLVSRFFFTYSLPSWRSKTRLRVDARCPCFTGAGSARYQQMLKLDEAIGLTDGLENGGNEQAKFLRLQKHPYHSINIINWYCHTDGPNHVLRDQSITTFFTRMSTVLYHIVFESCALIDVPQFLRPLNEARRLVSAVFKNCSSSWAENDANGIRILATHLTFDPLPYNVPRNFRGEDRPWAFFNHFPVLQTLTLHLDSLVKGVNRGFIAGLKNYRDNLRSNPLRLKIVGIATFEGTITEFLEAAIPIEQWTVVSITPGFENVLYVRSLKLMRLIIQKNPDDTWDPAFPFHVQLPSLRELYLYRKVTNSFNFLRFMPAVEKVVARIYRLDQLVEINSIPNEDRVDDFVSNTPIQNKFDKMKNLTYLDIDCFLDLDGLRILRVKAPGLMVLRACLRNNEMFSFVCKKWKMLNDVTLYPGSEVDDSVIPNLTKLKNLERFEIWNNRVLTDVSVNDGFLRMGKLRQLSICCTTNISEPCKESLRARFKVMFRDEARVPL